MGDLQEVLDAYRPPTAVVTVPLDGDEEVEFELTAISGKDYRDLIMAHPDPDGEARWDEDQFCPALIAACTDELSEDQAHEIWRQWPAYAAYGLFAAAWRLNEKGPGSVRALGV